MHIRQYKYTFGTIGSPPLYHNDPSDPQNPEKSKTLIADSNRAPSPPRRMAIATRPAGLRRERANKADTDFRNFH